MSRSPFAYERSLVGLFGFETVATVARTMAAPGAESLHYDEANNNDLFERLPFLADALLPRLQPAVVLQLSCTCRTWRSTVQQYQTCLSPKSQLAMPFIAGCLNLRQLNLSRMLPGPQPSSRCSLLCHLCCLAHLTHLDVSLSLTAAWRHQAGDQLDAHDLQHLSTLNALQVLSLAHQPCLQLPHALAPLAHLAHLTALNLSIADTGWLPDEAAWGVLGALTALVHLDLSGWSWCCCRRSEPQASQSDTTVAAGGPHPSNDSSVSSSSSSLLVLPGLQQQGHHSSGGGSSHNGSARAGTLFSRALNRFMHGGHVLGSSSSTTGATGVTAATADVGAAGGAGAGAVGAGSADRHGEGNKSDRGLGLAGASAVVPAPLERLCGLISLQELVLADWSAPPSCAGLAAIWQLPHLTLLDVSRCCQHPMTADSLQPRSNSSASDVRKQPVSLLDLLQGTTKHQQQQQHQHHQLALNSARVGLPPAGRTESDMVPSDTGIQAAGAAGPSCISQQTAAVVPAAVPTVLLGGLLRLHCAGLALVTFESRVWAVLSGLTHLNVSACSKLRGLGLSQLTALQDLVASDCPQLDYDAIKELLTCSRKLTRLDLQRSTVILHGDGHTAAQLNTGRYTRPQPQGRHQHRSHQQLQEGSTTPSSRRDVADMSGAGRVAAGAAVACLMTDSTSVSPGSSPTAAGHEGLQELFMSECQLAFESFVWRQQDDNNPAEGQVPSHPSLLLYDLVASSAQQLRGLHVLHWNRADAVLAAAVLSVLVPHASSSLTELALSSCSLPEDPSRGWQGLAAATNLRVLDLNHTGFSRQGYANSCGTNPTVALLTAVARMRLEVLRLAGWRFYFATFKPLAGLSHCLAALDLSRARDVTDSTLWSLTNLTSLTWLSVSGALVRNDQIFTLIFQHLSSLRHLDVSGVSAFSARSLSSLLQLPDLTSLDIRSTQATANATAVNVLVKLPNCRRLALSVAGDGEGYGRNNGRWQLLSAEVSSRASPAGGSGGVGSGSDSSDGLGVYSYLGQLGGAQSLRSLVLGGSTPSLTEYCRTLLPPWIEVR